MDYNISYFKLFLSIFSLYLSRIDGTKGCILKTNVPNEMKLYTLLKLDYTKEISFIDYLKTVSCSYDDAYVHTKTEMKDYIENIVDYIHYSINDVSDVDVNIENKNSVLTLNVYQKDLEIEYNPYFFSEVYVKHMLDNLLSMVNDILVASDKLCKEVNILSNNEKSLINNFSKGDLIDIDDDYTLAKAFRENALKNPTKIAINDGVNDITYGDLEKTSNSIAYDLQERYGVKKGTPVCLMLPRTYYFPELVLALNKIGAYYIPVDPKYPIKRIEHMVNLCQSKHIITMNNFEELKNFSIDIIPFEELNRELNVNIEINSDGNDLFSVIFTSGTTGLPKGVIYNNKQINNLIAFCSNLDLSSEDIIGVYRDFTFIGSYWLFVSLSMNMTCRILNELEQKDLLGLIKEFKENPISLIDIPPVIAPFFENNNIQLKYLFTSGSKIEKINCINSNLVNIYGSTETNMASACILDEDSNHITIGRPTVNKRVYILDEDSNQLPIGVPGEICVSSNYLSPGYINSPALTNNVFEDNPFSDCEEYSRLYHTGDIAFYNFEGELEIIGRMDDQLSVRGFRVESGEILGIMKKFNGISDVILNVVDDVLIAYYTVKGDVKIEEVKDVIKQELPYYMVPSIFIEIDEVPRNDNGKIDKSKLPKQSVSTENILPQNDLEQELLLMCQEILDNKNFGVTDDLLSLGFSSLSFMKLNYNIHSKFDINLKIIDLMECNTVREISNILDNVDSHSFKKYEKRDKYPLTKNQTIICKNREKNPNDFKMYYTVKISDVDVIRLKKSFIKAIDMHPFLKSSIITENGTSYIKRDDDEDISDLVNIYKMNKSDFDLFEKHLFDGDIAFYDEYFQPATTTFADKFFYCVMVEYENDVIVRLLFDHIAFDYYSLSLLFNEIDKIYFNKENKIEKEVIDGYDYNMLIVDDEHKTEDLFNEYRSEIIGYGDLFIPPIKEYENNCCQHDEVGCKIDKLFIQRFCNNHDVPYNRFFMATFALALHKYSGLDKGILPVVSNGRFFNELMYTQHYIAKTIYLKFELNQCTCFNDVLDNISSEMKRIMKMEPNSYIFTYDNQWLFNFIEIDQDELSFNLTDLNHDRKKPDFIKNVGENILNDIVVMEMEDIYHISIKFHKERYTADYIYSFLNCWGDIMEYIVFKDDLGIDLDFLDDVYEKQIQTFVRGKEDGKK